MDKSGMSEMEAGYDFRIIHGGMSMHERETLIEQLRTHKVDGLVNPARSNIRMGHYAESRASR